MNYTDWIIRVVKNVETVSGCDYDEADRRVGDAMHADHGRFDSSWAAQWYRANLSPFNAAYYCCALDWGWKPKSALDSPFEDLCSEPESTSQLRVRLQ